MNIGLVIINILTNFIPFGRVHFLGNSTAEPLKEIELLFLHASGQKLRHNMHTALQNYAGIILSARSDATMAYPADMTLSKKET